MRKTIIQRDNECEVIYAESIDRLIQQNSFKELQTARHVLFVTTQPFYEFYYEKFTKITPSGTEFHWYICPRKENLNEVKLYLKLLSYIEEMKLPTETIIIGAGNHEIFHLCGSLKVSSMYLDHFFYIPTTVAGFSQALRGISYLIQTPFTVCTQQYVLPDRLIYDTMLNELEERKVLLEDFSYLLQLGMAHDIELFSSLLNVKLLSEYQSFAPFLEAVIDIWQHSDETVDVYIKAITKSFYELPESHYLSIYQKERISFLFYFLWCLKKAKVPFDFASFYKWYQQKVDENLMLPIQMNTYELAESMTQELSRYSTFLGLKQIGKIEKQAIPTLEEMYEVVETYRRINK